MPVLGQKKSQESNTAPTGGILRKAREQAIAEPQLSEQAEMEAFHKQNVPTIPALKAYQDSVAPLEEGRTINVDLGANDQRIDEPGTVRLDSNRLNPEFYFTQPEPEKKSIVSGPVAETLLYGAQGAVQPVRTAARILGYKDLQAPTFDPEDAQFISPTTAKISQAAGELIGSTPGIMGAYGTTGRLASRALSRLAPNASRVLQEGVRGYGAGIGFQTGAEGLDAALDTRNDGDQSLTDRLKNIAVGGLEFAAGDAGLSAVGRGLRAAGSQLGRAASRIGQEGKAVVDELGNVVTGGNAMGILPGRAKAEAATPTMRHIVSSTSKQARAPIAEQADEAYMKTVDDIYRLRRADEIAAGAKGRELRPTESAYELGMASRGSDQISKQILLNDLVDMQGNVSGESLQTVMQALGKGKAREFEDYLVNRHAITRFDRGEKVYPDEYNWTLEQGRSIMAEYEAKYPEFKEATDKLTQFQDTFNKNWLVDSGLLPQETIEKWKQENPTYINMNRLFWDVEKGSGGLSKAKSGLSGQKSPIKSYSKTGSQRKIISPTESIINNVDATVKAAKRNQAMQALVKNIQDHPEAFEGIARIVDPDSKVSLKDIDLSTPEGLDEILNRFDQSYSAALKSNRKDMNNVVPVMVQGKPVYVEIKDKLLLDSVTSVTPQAFDGVTQVAAKITNFWKSMLTGVNPVFTLTRSIFRDPLSAYVQSKTAGNPVTYIADLAAAAYDTMRNADVYKEYKRIGGGYTSPNIGTPSLLNRSKRALVPSDDKVRGAVQRFGYAMAEALDKIESTTRLAEYKRLRKNGDIDDKLAGLREAQEVAVNFKRRGSTMRSWDAYFPYLNTAIQSLDKLGRTFKDNKFPALGKAAISVTAPAMLLYYFNSNNPKYRDLNDSEKDRFLHIPMPNGKFFRYPLPPELGPFANVPRRLLDQMRGQDENAWNEFGKTLLATLAPPGLGGMVDGFMEEGIPGATVGVLGDTFAGPLVEVAANKTWLGSPIVPRYLESKSSKNEFDANTSEIAKKLGGMTNSSPMQLDYLIRQYGGDIGNIVTSLGERGVREGGRGILEGVGKRLVVDSDMSNRLLNDFYELKDKYDTMYADGKEDEQFSAGYSDETRKYLGRASDNISKITAQIRQLDKELLPKDEKDARKRELVKQRNELARAATIQAKQMKGR